MQVLYRNQVNTLKIQVTVTDVIVVQCMMYYCWCTLFYVQVYEYGSCICHYSNPDVTILTQSHHIAGEVIRMFTLSSS